MSSLSDQLKKRVTQHRAVARALDRARASLAYTDSFECVLHNGLIDAKAIVSGEHFAREIAPGQHDFVDALRELAGALGAQSLECVLARAFRGMPASSAFSKLVGRYMDARYISTAAVDESARRLFTALSQTDVARELALIKRTTAK